MKSLIKTVAFVAVAAVPALAFSQQQPQTQYQTQNQVAQTQTNGPLTRAQVRQELSKLESVGYRPSMNDQYYPDDIQAAEARLNAEQTSGYGPATNGSSQSGGPAVNYAPPVGPGH